MRFNKLDLNLLVALDALLKERSVSRAAERLNLSQSATSNALARLREYFDDELLVQVGRKMEPTPRAQGLQDAVRDVLLRVDSTIAMQPQFDPAASDRSFRLFTSDYTQWVLGPHLMALAAEQRCNARFEFLAQVANPQRDLERGEADLLIIPQGLTSPDHPEERLYEDHFVCAVWRGSRLAQGELSFERYVAAAHVVMVPAATVFESFEAAFVRRYGVSRKVVATTFSFLAMPALVVGTEHVATIHARLARGLAAALPIEIRAVPLPIAPMQQAMQWHKYRTQDPGLVWLRSQLHAAVQRMDAADVVAL
jgi:LysR family transcriptional regulator, nod-box dependent transcriptional activator